MIIWTNPCDKNKEFESPDMFFRIFKSMNVMEFGLRWAWMGLDGLNHFLLKRKVALAVMATEARIELDF